MSHKPPTALRVPYITAYDEESVEHPLAFAFAPEAGGLRLTYSDPKAFDWQFGVLWARHLLHRGGSPEWKRVNTLRQRRCMLKSLCQVCGGPATDPDTGRIWWLLTDDPSDAGPDAAGYTNAPPTCRSCIPEAIESCPRLRRGASVYTVGTCEPYGVLGDMFAPRSGGRVSLVQRNATIPLDAFRMLEHALAKQLLVALHDLQPSLP